MSEMEEHLKNEIRCIVESWQIPEITFQTDTMIYFREIEDLISWFFKKFRKKGFVLNPPAIIYYCKEQSGNRYYYLIKLVDEGKEIKLVTGDATDYSGHGGGDKRLAEYFIKKILYLDTIERPLSYLIGDLKYELHKLTMR